jgi:hypothetical protein
LKSLKKESELLIRDEQISKTIKKPKFYDPSVTQEERHKLIAEKRE